MTNRTMSEMVNSAVAAPRTIAIALLLVMRRVHPAHPATDPNSGLPETNLLPHPVDEGPAGGHRPEGAGGLSERVAGRRTQLDISGGDVELELLNAGRAR